ncbi:MAG: hypothetical protein AB1656_18870 [Candidatus Omnitrophota bacterium]
MDQFNSIVKNVLPLGVIFVVSIIFLLVFIILAKKMGLTQKRAPVRHSKATQNKIKNIINQLMQAHELLMESDRNADKVSEILQRIETKEKEFLKQYSYQNDINNLMSKVKTKLEAAQNRLDVRRKPAPSIEAQDSPADDEDIV